MSKKSIIFILTITILLMCCIGCTSDDKALNNVVASVNGEDIFIQEALFYLAITKNEFESMGGKDIWDTPFDGRSAEEVAKERALESIIKDTLLKQKADEIDLSLSDEELANVDVKTKSLIETISPDRMDEIGITHDEIKQLVIENILGIYALYNIEIIVNEDEVRREVDKYLNEYKNSGKKARVRILYFPIVDSEGDLLPEDQQAKAEGEANEAKVRADEGMSFEELAQMYSKDDVDAIQISLREDEVYDNVLFDLNLGDVVLLSTTEGYQLIFLEDYIYPDEELINETRMNLEQIITEQKTQEVYNDTYEEWKLESDIEINEELWSTITIKK